MAAGSPVGILDLHGATPRFTVMVGTGGIGHGTFFLLEGNASLGREESKMKRNSTCGMISVLSG